MQRIEERLVRDVSDLDRMDSKYGVLFETSSLWAEIKRKFQSTREALQGSNAAELTNPYTVLVSELIELMRWVGDHSNLILDPELDSYYMMETTVNRLPMLADFVGRARGLAAEMVSRENIPEIDRFRLLGLVSDIKSQQQQVQHNVEVAIAETRDANLRATIEPASVRCDGAIDRFVETISEVLNPKPETVVIADIPWLRGSEALSELDALYASSSNSLERLLQKRVSSLKAHRLAIGLLTLFSGLLLLYLAIALILSILRTIEQLDAASVRLLEKNDSSLDEVNITVDTRDELGQITHSFASLAGRIKNESRALRNAELRIRAILDGAADGVITINERDQIETVNLAAERLFGFPKNELLGMPLKHLITDFSRDNSLWMRKHSNVL
ncbi:MAG: PAS domain-containing protein, partial [Planctomycetes bacterium]|nr:PAS domain-containing protein [Planctomycetota bacterium]